MSRWLASVGFAFGLSLAAVAARSQDAGESQGSMQGMPMGDGGTIGGMMAGGGMSCSQMMGGADVTVQNTKDGATIRMRAKSKDQVQRVQQMAQMMKSCMSGEQR